MAEERPEWAAWLREQFDRHPRIRLNADLSRASGEKPNGRPVIDPSSVTQWLRGRRPTYELAVAAAKAFGAPVEQALEAAGYDLPGQLPSLTQSATGTVGPASQTARPVGYGLDEEVDGLTDDDIEDVRALIRAKRARRGLT